jgi:antitoxin component YwqK of YwqJK toxin-antitoxin module
MASAVKKRSKSKAGKPAKQPRRTTRIDHHKDGSIRAKGTTRGGKLDGYWEWFRLDGTIMRSGHFENGRQVGQWTTYDAKGRVYKVTRFK